MGKYLFTLAILGTCMYLYMSTPINTEVTTEYEIAQLHNPLIPIPASVREIQEESDANMQANAKIILVSSPIASEGVD